MTDGVWTTSSVFSSTVRRANTALSSERCTCDCVRGLVGTRVCIETLPSLIAH